MSLISKSDIAAVIGVSADTIPDAVYNWAVAQMLAMLGIKAADTTRTHREFIGQSTSWIALRDRDIKSIDSLVVGSTTVSINIGTNVKVNEDTGMLWYSGGFSDKVVVGYTINAYTPNYINDAIVSTLTLKNLAIFQPTVVSASVKKITIGKYSKTYGTVASNLEQFIDSLDMELYYLRDMYFGFDGQLKTGIIQ
ncbi:hypothetical protein LCGC14_0306110 [marine sediment metagenome]|uniref:Uncharacterized protein n=1 Tax=marine sediment metagenome TaxID=412755 RepID=A0A0F9U683_9ZZZZ